MTLQVFSGSWEFLHRQLQIVDSLTGKLIRFSTEFAWSYIELILTHEDDSGVCLGDPVGSGDLISPDKKKTI
jgi:hypothetical protein